MPPPLSPQRRQQYAAAAVKLFFLLVVIGIVKNSSVVWRLSMFVTRIKRLWQTQESSLVEVEVNYCDVPNMWMPSQNAHPERYYPRLAGHLVDDRPLEPGAAAAAAAAQASDSEVDRAIYEGSTVDGTNNNFPYVVALAEAPWPGIWKRSVNLDMSKPPLVYPHFTCTGVLINPSYVLTNSHCIHAKVHQYWAGAGMRCRPDLGGVLEQAPNGHAQFRKVRKLWLNFPDESRPATFLDPLQHNNPNNKAYDGFQESDIAVMELEEPFKVDPGWVETIKLVDEESCKNEWTDTVAGNAESFTRRLSIAGWGKMARMPDNPSLPLPPGAMPSRLQWYDVLHMSQMSPEEREACKAGDAYRRNDPNCDPQINTHKGLICFPLAPKMHLPQTCTGDSGSPVVRRDIPDLAPQLRRPPVLIGVHAQKLFNEYSDDLDKLMKHSIAECGGGTLSREMRLCGHALQWVKNKITATAMEAEEVQ